MTKTRMIALGALIVAVALVIARLELADERADLSESTRVRDLRWDNYLLAEQRQVHGNVPGALIAIAASTGRDSAFDDLPNPDEPLNSTEVQRIYGELRQEAIAGVNAFAAKFREHEDRIGHLVVLETVLFLLTLFITFLGAIYAPSDRSK